jgi:hypothetical protein
MSSVLIVGGDQIDGIKHLLGQYGINQINHWSGRKASDGHKIIPKNTRLVVLITDWISHSFTHHIKRVAAKRGLKVIYTGNGAGQLHAKLKSLEDSLIDACRKTIKLIL